MSESKETHNYNISLTVNGKAVQRSVTSHRRLLDFLRDDLNLTGAKDVCGEGECGACTVIMDGKTVNSCLILVVETEGSNIRTIEGLADKKILNAMQQAFVDYHSVQCGYCIPGMVLSGEQILEDYETPDRATIQEDLSGNICRCTGYHKIIDAVEAVGKIRADK